MSGKFINTKRQETIEKLIDGMKNKIDNPYYLHTDKKPTIVDYYHINDEGSSLDQGLQISEEQLGYNSPFKYDLIKDFYLYGGFTQIQLQIDNSEFGLQAENITSTTYVLPNTIKPIPGDFFRISYVNESYLFKVLSVNMDGLESGANFYRLDFEFSKKDDSQIKHQVKDTYKFLIDNIGTNFTTVLKKEEYDYIGILQEITNKLKEYYINLYYSHRVQSFISTGDTCGDNFYDPILTEFLIRNNILQGDTKNYIYITQQVGLSNTFGIDYDKSFFRSLETKSIDRLSSNTYVIPEDINQPLSLLCMRLEPYYLLKHVSDKYNKNGSKFEVFTKSLLERIRNSDVRKDNIILESYKKFKGNIFVNENVSVSKFTQEFKGMLTVIKNEDIGLYNGIINILQANEETEDTKLFKDIINVTNTSFETDTTFTGQLVLPTNVKTKLYDGILTIFKQSELKQNTVMFKGVVFIDNSVAHNRNMIDNLIVKYFNNIDISIEDIKNIEDIQYVSDSILYYYIPILIYILEDYIKTKLHKTLA